MESTDKTKLIGRKAAIFYMGGGIGRREERELLMNSYKQKLFKVGDVSRSVGRK